MNNFCYSCAAPLDMPRFKGPAEHYCKYCSDEEGNLRTRDEIKNGIAAYMKTWQPEIDDEKALVRAEFFMKSMPAWAD